MRWPGGGSATAVAATAPDLTGVAHALMASRSRCRSARSASRSRRRGKSSCSAAWTRPRCRSGRRMVSSRGSAPMTGTPSCAIASATSRRWRSLPTRLSTTPAIRTSGSCEQKPRTTAAADCACADTSSTSSTGNPNRAARSAAAPVRPRGPGTPSNNPMTPSMTSSSQCRAVSASSQSRSDAGIAQVSRLNPRAPVAAA